MIGSGDAASPDQVKPMPKKLNSTTNAEQPMVYQITLKGHLGREWTDWFGDMAIDLTEDGHTLLTGPVADQAALHGLLKKVRDLGLPLLAVHCVEPMQGPGTCDQVSADSSARHRGINKENQP